MNQPKIDNHIPIPPAIGVVTILHQLKVGESTFFLWKNAEGKTKLHNAIGSQMFRLRPKKFTRRMWPDEATATGYRVWRIE